MLGLSLGTSLFTNKTGGEAAEPGEPTEVMGSGLSQGLRVPFSLRPAMSSSVMKNISLGDHWSPFTFCDRDKITLLNTSL